MKENFERQSSVEKKEDRIFLEIGLSPYSFSKHKQSIISVDEISWLTDETTLKRHEETTKGLGSEFRQDTGRFVPPVPVGGNKKWDPEDVYIGLDLNQEKVRWAHSDLEDLKKEGLEVGIGSDRVIFTAGDAAKTPFPDRSIKTIFFANVFGDPHIDSSVKQEFLNEASRLLEPDGELVVLETDTPDVADQSKSAPDEKFDLAREFGSLKDFLAKAGFNSVKFFYREDPSWKTEVSEFTRYSAKQSDSFTGNDFLIKAKIQKEPEGK